MTDGRDRRSVLRAGAALCSAFAAGCLGDGGGGEDDGEENRTNGTMPGGPGNGSDPIDNGSDPGGNESDPGGNETNPDDPEDPADDEEPEPDPVTAWPMQQYDSRNTGSVEAAPPRENVEIAWTHDLAGRLPVVDASRIVRDWVTREVELGAWIREAHLERLLEHHHSLPPSWSVAGADFPDVSPPSVVATKVVCSP